MLNIQAVTSSWPILGVIKEFLVLNIFTVSLVLKVLVSMVLVRIIFSRPRRLAININDMPGDGEVVLVVPLLVHLVRNVQVLLVHLVRNVQDSSL